MAASALAHEVPDDSLGYLTKGVRRKYVHWTFVRPQGAGRKRPSEFTRESFYQHLEKVYALAYPVPESPSGSILMFASVAQERHAQAWKAEHRDVHFHAAVYCVDQHYWSKVAKISREQFHVYMHARAHDSYTDMWRYIREPSTKKPLSELDGEVYLSPLHPRGEELSKVLEAGDHHARFRRGERTLKDLPGQRPAKIPRVTSVYNLITENNITTVQELYSYANKQAQQGNLEVAEFCARHGSKLAQMVASVRNVVEAPQRSLEAQMTLMDKLRRAGQQLVCCCGGSWVPGAVDVLQRNNITVREFVDAMRDAFTKGAKRGVNVALVGRGGCGKSMLIEPLEQIFKTASKPQKGSSFPLVNVMECDIILWQDYKHHEGTVSYTDLLSLFVGEAIDVRVPMTAGAVSNVKFRNVAPTVYTGRAPMTCASHASWDVEEAHEYTGMMNERFRIFKFTVPLAMGARNPNHPQCGSCCARFLLEFSQPPAPSAPLGAVAGSSRPETAGRLLHELQEIEALRLAGGWSAEEAQAARRVLLGLAAVPAARV